MIIHKTMNKITDMFGNKTIITKHIIHVISGGNIALINIVLNMFSSPICMFILTWRFRWSFRSWFWLFPYWHIEPSFLNEMLILFK
jgi:hypothetical protein